jgi:hypothetical protein
MAEADFLAQAVPVGVTPDVQPVSAPALAIPRVGEELVHDLLISIRRRVGPEGL